MLSDAAKELMGRMLQKSFYVALRTPRDLVRLSDVLEAHLRWMIAAEKRGEIFASGPFVGENGPPGSMGGMTVIRAASLEAAESIVSGDPFISEGIYDVKVAKWLLMEGSFTLSVSFSDQEFKLR